LSFVLDRREELIRHLAHRNRQAQVAERPVAQLGPALRAALQRGLDSAAPDALAAMHGFRPGRVEQDTSLLVLRDLTLDFCQSAVLPAVTTPRSLDLVHLRSALWFHAADRIDRFVTLDAAQQQSARELGLPV